MSHNHSRSTEQQRGKKRNSSHLLPTNNENNTDNPRSAKRQRTASIDTTLQALLTMSVSEINALPQALRKQAIALRESRNICNQDNHRNNNNNHNHNNHHNTMAPNPFNTDNQISDDDDHDEDDDDDDDGDDSEDEQDYTAHFVPQQQPKKQHPNNKASNASSQRNYIQPDDAYNTYQYRPNPISNTIPNTNTMKLPTRVSFPSMLPQQQQQQQQPLGVDIPSNITNTSNISQQHPSLHYNGRQRPSLHPATTIIDEGEVSVPSVPRYYNAQQLVIREEPTKRLSCYAVLVLMFCVIMIVPFFMAISFSNRYGTKYCDTNATSIKAYNNTFDCTPCPKNTRYCVGGEAVCEDKSYWVDPEINECVKISYKTKVINIYKTMWKNMMTSIGNGVDGMINYYNTEMIKWKSIKEWKSWWQNLQNLSFEEFCKKYEMEIMVWYFVLTYNLPIFRCLIIFFWTRMILPTLSGDDDKLIIVYIKLLSYFSPIMFSYGIWNKITAIFT